jgi:hypothetical protein
LSLDFFAFYEIAKIFLFIALIADLFPGQTLFSQHLKSKKAYAPHIVSFELIYAKNIFQVIAVILH